MPTGFEKEGQRSRLADVAERFQKKAGPGRPWESVFKSLYELFTKDVTQEGIRDLLKRDPQAAFRFFTREIDFKALRSLPWYRRYPEIVARVFIALAYQLSPPRRIAFALGCVLFVLGLLPTVSYRDAGGGQLIIRTGANPWWLLSLGIFVILLLMELRDKLSLKADLEIAREIQGGLVASGAYLRGDFKIYCSMRPANTVGGDYCDLIDLAERDRTAIVIGDVAGKGMPAALLMALLQGSLRTLLTAGHRGADLVAKLNNYLSASIPQNIFVTLFYAELDHLTGHLEYVNAGHNPPFLRRWGGSLERLGPTSMVLGIRPDNEYLALSTEIRPLDHLLLFTDGLPEAADLMGNETVRIGSRSTSEAIRRKTRLSWLPA